MKKTNLFILIFLFWLQQIFSQESNIKFEKISVENGLSQSSVLSIIQDSKGFMWFATLDGLNKYDGYNIHVYRNKPDDIFSVSDNIINVLYETKDKQNSTLWIGTAANGLCSYNKIKDNFTVFKHQKSNPKSLSNNTINDIKGNNKTLWIATNKGLNEFDIKNRIFYKYRKNSDNNSLCSDTVKCLSFYNKDILYAGTAKGLNIINIKTDKIERIKPDILTGLVINALKTDNQGILWIGCNKGLFSYDIFKKELKSYTDFIKKNKKTYKTINITSLSLDKENILWIGTQENGLIKLNTISKKVEMFKHDPVNNNSLSVNNILSVYVDKSGILWVGTSLGGINKWNRAAENLRVFRHNPYDKYSLSAPQVRTFYVDKNNTVWVGTVEGGLNKWDKNKGKFFHYMHNSDNPKSISHNHIRSILEDSKGNFWVATDGGGLNLFNREKGTFKYIKAGKTTNSLSHNRVWKIYEDKDKNLWIGTFGGGLNLFLPENQTFKRFMHEPNNPNSLCNNEVTSILQDKNGYLWIGTFGGLNKFDIKNNIFKKYIYLKNDSNSLSNNRVYCIYEDKEGFLWIGTKGGLNKFIPDKEKFISYTTENSELPNNVILGIAEDNEYLWLSTNNGISRFNKKTKKFKNFNIGDGLQNNEFLAGSYYKKSDGEILFGGIDGFNAFYPEKISDNPNIPSIAITKFQISNRDIKTDTAITFKKRIILEHYENDISFEFVALDFIFPEKNKYKYKLEGYNKDWEYAGFRRYAKYTNLKPGKYIFKVTGSNNDDVWNETGTSITIIIKPAIWQTLWFKIASIVFIFLILILIYHLRVKNIKKRNEKLEKEVKRRTYEIRQQNEEIKSQRDELAFQKDQISKQKEEITDSIRYAKKIQTAVLPTDEYISEILPEHFILFKPRDIVSGDFYWVSKNKENIIITAADCTGHGVPGAFMSMLGISFLNKIVNEKDITDPGEILNLLRKNIIQALHQKGYETESKDGMDMALCVINTKNNSIRFSGAFNPLFYLSNGKITEIKADRMPVAKYDQMLPFSVKKIKPQKGDIVYMFSDGYQDQFGGPKKKKFMKAKFKKLLEEIHRKPLKQQKEILNQTIEKWKGDEPQIDDIVVIGIKI